MPIRIPYKSFCWGLGTTSFRTKNFNKTIEKQLALLNEFWNDEENNSEEWCGNNVLQEKYYDFMKDNGFVMGNANNKPKDAREKTSGLVDIGLIDANRKLTEAGNALLKISYSNDFTSDNLLQIPKDSFIYLKQLLKTSNDVNGNNVRPFVVLMYLLHKLEYLTIEEFTYLLPLCTDEENTSYIVEQIKTLRTLGMSVDEIIINRLMSMNNYKMAYELFLKNKVTEDIICTIGMNRKSHNYDKPYFALYNELYDVFVKHKKSSIIKVFRATKKVNIGKLWRGYLFDTIAERTIEREPEKHLNLTMFSSVKSENEFKETFYKIMHLFKAKATLSDYLDLNRRYIRTTDVILFEDGMVKADIIPKQFFNSVVDELYSYAFTFCDKLFEDCELKEIADCLVIDEKVIVDGINKELGTSITNMSEAYMVLEENRYRRL